MIYTEGERTILWEILFTMKTEIAKLKTKVQQLEHEIEELKLKTERNDENIKKMYGTASA